MIRKSLFLAGLAGIALSPIASTVHAQEGARIEEVIVTAQRREESLLEAPVTVTAVSGDILESQNVRTLTDLTVFIPGMEIQPDGPRVAIRLRGIATADGAPAAENIAALHVDGVYISHRTELEGYFYDVARVEALPGPQGTLYGRNTAAGTINIISNRPVNERASSTEVEFGNYNTKRLFGMMNVPLSDELAVRAAFQSRSHDGYFDSGIDGEQTTFGRLGIQWNPSDRVSLYTKLDYGKIWRRGIGNGILGSVNTTDGDRHVATWYDGDQWFNDSVRYPEDSQYYTPPFYDFRGNEIVTRPFFGPPSYLIYDANGTPIEPRIFLSGIENSIRRHDLWGAMTELTVDITDNISLIATAARIEETPRPANASVSGNRPGALHAGYGPYYGGVGAGREKGEPWLEQTLEVRLQGTAADQLDWTIGYFYWEDDTNENSDNPFGIAFHAPISLAESNAVYGQVTWTPLFNDRLHLTAGGRKTDDWKQWDFQVNFYNAVTVGGSGGLLTQEWDDTDYKLGIAWDLGESSMIYSNLSTGFRAGSWFPGPLPSYNPEFVEALEIGWKGLLLDDRLQLGFDAYRYDYIDAAIQFDSFNTISMRDEIGYGNLGNAEVLGANLNGRLLASDNDMVEFNIDLTNAEIIFFDFESVLERFPTLPNGDPLYTLDAVFNWTGLDLPNTTPLRGTVAWTHTFNLGGGGTVDSRLQGVYNAGRYYNYREGSRAQYEFDGLYIDPYTTLDWNVSYRPVEADYHLGFYIRNLTDERIPNSLGNTLANRGTLALNPPPNGDQRYLTGTLRPPRTFGFRLGYEF